MSGEVSAAAGGAVPGRWPIGPRAEAAARRWWSLAPPRPRAPTKQAASVIPVRDGADGLEVFVLRRAPTMAFAPDAVVFPGGGRDPADADLGQTAVRELFEECGLLLAAGTDGRSVMPAGPGWEESRRALIEHRTTLAELLRAHRLSVRTELLHPWARWVTPSFLPQRYDTWFFVAEVPAGQQPRHVGGESVQSGWEPAGRLIADDAHPDRLLPPTRTVLSELAAAGTVARVLATRRQLRPLITELVEEDGVLYTELIDSGDWPDEGPDAGPDDWPDLRHGRGVAP